MTASSSGLAPAGGNRPPSRGAALDRNRLVHVGAGLQQDPDDVDAPFADRKQQRREAGRQRACGVRAGLDERLDDRRMAFGGRPHQRRLSAPSPWCRPSRRRSSALTRPSAPVRAAVINGVSPPGSAVRVRAAFRSSSTIAPLPFVQASESGVTP